MLPVETCIAVVFIKRIDVGDCTVDDTREKGVLLPDLLEGCFAFILKAFLCGDIGKYRGKPAFLWGKNRDMEMSSEGDKERLKFFRFPA